MDDLGALFRLIFFWVLFVLGLVVIALIAGLAGLAPHSEPWTAVLAKILCSIVLSASVAWIVTYKIVKE